MNDDFLNSIQPVIGFAGMNGGTRGGNGGKTVTATSGDELQALIDGAAGPIIIAVKDNVRGSNTKDDEILIKNKSFVSIVGSGSGVDFADVGIRFFGSKNLILHNVGVSKVKEGSKDAVGFESGCQNFIVSHCDLSSQFDGVSKDFYDGALDVKRGSVYGTFLYNHIHDHHKASLVGHTDDDDTKPLDRFVSYYRNWFYRLGSRCPSVRYGFADIHDNYYLDIDTTAINLREGAKGYVSGNVFENVDDPIVGVDSDFPGLWNLGKNLFKSGVTWGSKPSKGEASAQDGKSTTDYKPPCTYTPLPLEAVEADVRANAGVIDPEDLPVPGASDQPAPDQPQQPVEEPPAPIEEPPAAEPDQPNLPGVPEPEQPAPVETEEPAEAEALLDQAEDALMNLRVILAKLAAEPEEPSAPVSDPAGLLALIDGATAALEKLPETKPRKNALDYMRKGRDHAEKALRG